MAAVTNAGSRAGRKLQHYINRYGEQNIKAIIAGISKAPPNPIGNHEPYAGSVLDEEMLERMYRDYVATCRNPMLTFIEYKALLDIIRELM